MSHRPSDSRQFPQIHKFCEHPFDLSVSFPHSWDSKSLILLSWRSLSRIIHSFTLNPVGELGLPPFNGQQTPRCTCTHRSDGSFVFHVAPSLPARSQRHKISCRSSENSLRFGPEQILFLLSVLAAIHRARREIFEGFDLVLLSGRTVEPFRFWFSIKIVYFCGEQRFEW